jgi:hypothetical protein
MRTLCLIVRPLLSDKLAQSATWPHREVKAEDGDVMRQQHIQRLLGIAPAARVAVRIDDAGPVTQPAAKFECTVEIVHDQAAWAVRLGRRSHIPLLSRAARLVVAAL